MSIRIFLSHSSDDKDLVRRLGEDLRRAGLEVWLDEKEIRVGEWVTKKIEQGLDATQYVAVWLTRRSGNLVGLKRSGAPDFTTKCGTARL